MYESFNTPSMGDANPTNYILFAYVIIPLQNAN